MEVAELLSEDKKKIDQALDRYLPRRGSLSKAMRYSVFAGGKRFRPSLCLATARALMGSEKKTIPFACAVEMIHTFTLIHDDLPAMDNSDYRRGKPTNHKLFGEGIAILAGDALNTLAFNLIADTPAASKELSTALFKVVEGQVSDLESSDKKVSLKELRSIHQWKTAALLKACVRGTGRLCGASAAKLKALTNYADHLGLAFQIADDILDVTSTRKKLGKPVKADVGKGFPFVIGLERSREMAEQERGKSLAALRGFDQHACQLRDLVEFVVKRES